MERELTLRIAIAGGIVKGHDFSRAAKHQLSKQALAPEGRSLLCPRE